MSASFVLDEASWGEIPSSDSALASAIDQLLERIEYARSRREPVYRLEDFYYLKLHDGQTLCDFLYSSDALNDGQRELERDLLLRLSEALDKTAPPPTEELMSGEAEMEGTACFAPAICWAHVQQRQRKPTALLPLPLTHRFAGHVEVRVDGLELLLFFVTSRQEHLDFVRDAVLLERADVQTFAARCPLCFPDLEWSDTALDELSRWKYFRQDSALTLRHLAVLNDHGARLFCEHPGGMGVEEQLGALGVNASTENGNTRSHAPSRQDRTRRFRGEALLFWWHTKMTPQEGRIHFHHVPPKLPSDEHPNGRIVIGIFTDHCR
ncbi:MAG: hypothetical protein ACKO6N_00885 [Myxococcota bacterium]